jgi:mono/diheme cytochrome c family protein
MLAATAALAALVPVGSASAEPPPGPGADTYATHCARCHGAEGQPELAGAPDFTRGQGFLKSDAELIEAIRFGVGTMPGFEGLIDSEEMIDVLYYIRALER